MAGGHSVVGLAIEVILIATLGIAAMGLLATANYTGWGTVPTMMFQVVLPIIICVAFIVLILKKVGWSVNM